MIHWMLAALLLSAPAPACEDAAAVCRCLPFTAEEAAERADAIFLVTVESVREVAPEERRGPGTERAVRMRLEAAWKGVDVSTTEVTMIERGTSCDIRFQAGERYVVYADRREGTFVTGMCSGTRMLTPDEEELAPLGEPGLRWPDADPRR